MPIQVDKSPIISMDEKMNDALQGVITQLNKQSKYVKSVSVLSNFSLDTEAALIHDVPFIVQGIVVCLAKDYVFSPQDMSWFHPDVARGRSVYNLDAPISKSTLQSMKLKGYHNSVGEYQISTSDEFGCEQVENRLVVDVSNNELFELKYSEWLNQGITAGDLDNEWKRMAFGNTHSIVKKSEELRDELAHRVSKSATLIHSDMTHSILSDISNVYVTNAAVQKSKDNRILVKTSPLGGYKMYKTGKTDRKFFPPNLGIANTFYAWSELSGQNCAKIVNTCMWPGSLSYNTQVMRPPLIKNTKSLEEHLALMLVDILKMRHSAFSASDAVIDKLSPSDILRLTPTTLQSPNASLFIAAPLSMTHPVFSKLMNNIEQIQSQFPDIQLFNSKYVTDGRLQIPRKLYESTV